MDSCDMLTIGLFILSTGSFWITIDLRSKKIYMSNHRNAFAVYTRVSFKSLQRHSLKRSIVLIMHSMLRQHFLNNNNAVLHVLYI